MKCALIEMGLCSQLTKSYIPHKLKNCIFSWIEWLFFENFKVIMSISSFVQCLACPAFVVIYNADSTAQSELAGDWPYTEVMLENHNFLFGRTFIKVCVFFLKLFSSSEKHFKDFFLSLFCWKFYSSCSFLALTIP